MEMIQIFNRATSEWSERHFLQAGYSETFVKDKSTDSAEGITFRTYKSVPYRKGDWALLLHIEDKDDPILYDDNGITTNATQYIIRDIQKKYFKSNELWVISLTLEEPIERFKSVLGETLSFTNQTRKVYSSLDSGGQVQTDIYYKEPYNYYTALRRWLMVTPANCDNYPYDYLNVGSSGDVLVLKNPGYAFSATIFFSVYFSDGTTLVVSKFSNVADITFQHLGTGSPAPLILDKTLEEGETFLYSLSAGSITNISAGYNDFKDVCTFNYTTNNFLQSPLNKSWWNRIKILDEAWLSSMSFSDDTWNELDLYRVLFDKYDPLGKTPVAYFDLNTTTGLPNNLLRDEYLLKFERQDGFDKPEISYSTLESGASSITETDSADDFTGLVSNVENLSSGFTSYFPAKGHFAFPELEQAERSTTGASSNSYNQWHLRLPFPIKKIVKLMRWEFDTGIPIRSSLYKYDLDESEKTDNVLKKRQWEAFVTDISKNRNYYHFEQGDNKLYVNDYYYSVGSIAYAYSLEYEPMPSVRIIYGDTEKAMQINQSSSQVDSGLFGKFLNSYKNGLNKVDIIIEKHYYEYNEFADMIGSIVRRDNKKYMITQLGYRNIGTAGYVVAFQLNENHMRKNQTYQASQEISKDTSISISNLKDRKTCIKQTINIAINANNLPSNNSPQLLTDKKDLFSAMVGVSSDRFPQIAVVETKSILYTNEGLTTTKSFSNKKIASIAKSLGDKQINLVVSFFDNAEAGRTKTVSLVSKVGLTYSFGDVESQTPLLYTDPFGEGQKVDISIGGVSPQEALAPGEHAAFDSNIQEEVDEYNKRFAKYKAIGAYPKIEGGILNGFTTAVNLAGLLYQKDMLEKLSINATIEAKGVDCIITQALLKSSRLLTVTNTPGVGFIRKQQIYVIDRKIAESESFIELESYDCTTTNSGNYIKLSFSGKQNTVLDSSKAAVICTTLFLGATKLETTPLIIINEITDEVINSIKNGELKIYFN